MKIHFLQHVDFEDPGSILSWAVRSGHSLSGTEFFVDASLPSAESLDWIVVMGGPFNVLDDDKYPWLKDERKFIEKAIRADIMVLGICLGAQLIAQVLGAPVYKDRHKEIGWYPVELTPAGAESRVFSGFPQTFDVFHWHADTFDLPIGARLLATNTACENQAFAYGDRVLGLQFHMEMTRQIAGQLVSKVPEDLIPGPFTQSARELLSDQERFSELADKMSKVLNRMERITVDES
ncbi:MAG: type 1 glutamine amidotransferase [bacterium]|nr:type 1 glutamine amidotransferase [bacterium]